MKALTEHSARIITIGEVVGAKTIFLRNRHNPGSPAPSARAQKSHCTAIRGFVCG
jgi:hypothetical protein